MNLEKTKVVVFTPGFIWGHIGKVTYKKRVTGGGGAFQERKRTRES